MVTSTLSSRQLNQDSSSAKKAAASGPVIITDRGKPSHVLMTYEEYQRLTGQSERVIDVMAMPDDVDVEFDPPRMNFVPKAVDLT